MEVIEVQTEDAWFLKITEASFFNMFTEKSPTFKQRVGGRGSFASM
jgi:hypothetical protein